MFTSDVYLAAALLSRGYELVQVDRTDPRHMKFQFSESALTGSYNLESVKLQWTNKTLSVNAFEFSEAIKRMKSIIHSS